MVCRGLVVDVYDRYCPLCAEYVESIVRSVTPEALQSANVKLVIIGNGSRRMLPAYSKLATTLSRHKLTPPQAAKSCAVPLRCTRTQS